MKKIITAEAIRNMAHEGKKQIEVNFTQCLITPEARVIAAELGVAISEIVASDLASSPASAASNHCALNAKPSISAAKNAEPSAEELAQIRAAVLAQLPPGAASDELVDQLVRKMLAEQRPNSAAAGSQVSGADQDNHCIANGIKRIKGDRVQLSQFVGVSDHQVGLADVITSADNSSMAAGFMAWKECFFPWTLNYDEVDIVLEGELHIRSGGETVVAKAGDVVFIPKGSAIEFGTPSTVRFFYVTYPADYLAQ